MISRVQLTVHAPAARVAPRRRVSCLPVLLLLVALFAAEPRDAEALARPPHPVIFVHGLASDAGTWAESTAFLVAQGWVLGGTPTFIPATQGVTSVSAGDFYTMNFSDHDVVPFRSQTLALDRQGFELSKVIQAVLGANPGAEKVILVAHSMGGLAAREYLQGLARLSSTTATIPYRHDVAQLVGIGVPHLGSPFAAACRTFADQCRSIAIDPDSAAIRDLGPDSPALVALNNLGSHPLPADVRYDSIAGLGGVGPAGDGDGVVDRPSQEFLATVPGLTHRLQEVVVPKRDDCGASFTVGPTVVFLDVHRCEPGDPGVLNGILDALLHPRLTLTLNRAVVAPGQSLTVTLASEAGVPETGNLGDLYVGVRVPGNAIFLLTATGFVLAFDGAEVVSSGIRPLRAATTVASGAETIFSTPVGSSIPTGLYTFLAVLVKPGTTPTVEANWLSNLATASVTVAASIPAPVAP